MTDMPRRVVPGLNARVSALGPGAGPLADPRPTAAYRSGGTAWTPTPPTPGWCALMSWA